MTSKFSFMNFTNSLYIPIIRNGESFYKDKIPVSKRLLVLDIDNTLYSPKLKFKDQIRKRLQEMIIEKNLFTNESVNKDTTSLLKSYKKKYGSVSKGLWISNPQLSEQDYVKDVNEKLDFNVIHPDPELFQLLKSIDSDIIALTNAPKAHAECVLKKLGIESCFKHVLHIDLSGARNFIEKPDNESYQFVENLFDVEPENIFFVDDKIENVRGALKRNWNAELVWEGRNIYEILRDFKIKFDNSNK